MQTREFGLYFGTRRLPVSKRPRTARVFCESAMLVRYLVLGGEKVAVILTSRPIHAGAARRQIVPVGQFLNLSRLTLGFPAVNTTTAKG